MRCFQLLFNRMLRISMLWASVQTDAVDVGSHHVYPKSPELQCTGPGLDPKSLRFAKVRRHGGLDGLVGLIGLVGLVGLGGQGFAKCVEALTDPRASLDAVWDAAVCAKHTEYPLLLCIR